MSTPKEENEVIEIKSVDMFARRADRSEDWCVRTSEHDVFVFLPSGWPRARVIETVPIIKRACDKAFATGKRCGRQQEREKIAYGFEVTLGKAIVHALNEMKDS